MTARRVIYLCVEKSVRAIGAVTLIFAAFLMLSLLSYSPEQPSLNNATFRENGNLGGAAGAVVADILAQIFGFSWVPLVIVIAAWGVRMSLAYTLPRPFLRMAAAFIMAAAFSTLLALLEIPGEVPIEMWPSTSYAGGALGLALAIKLFPVIPAPVLKFSALAVFIYGFYFALGIKRKYFDRAAARFREAWEKIARVFAKKKQKAVIQASYTDTSPEQVISDYKSKIASPVKKPERKTKEKQRSLGLGIVDGDFELPSPELLRNAPERQKNIQLSETALSQNARILVKVLADFGVQGEITQIRPGPVVTLYELEPAAGTKSSRVIGLSDDIARSMSAVSTRIAVIPGKNALGIELPNSIREKVVLREMVESDDYRSAEAKLPLVLGKDIGGAPIVADLAKMPHLLVAGTTGSGKSVAINTMILSLVYRMPPSKCKFIMIDPKMLELSVYDGIPHLLSPVVTEPGKAVVALKWVVREMENRYRLMSNLGVRNIDGYNTRLDTATQQGEKLYRTVQTGFDAETGKPVIEKVELEMNKLPYIVVIVDEMADLMLVAGKDIESSVQRLAQMARAAGIHIIMATQRPSVDVITGVIKANFPTRISFQVTSKIDSRTILGEQGAEQLLGAGDMLYMAGGGRISRVHGAFVGDGEVEKVVSFLKTQGEPEYVEGITEEDEEFDPAAALEGEGGEGNSLYDKAVAVVIRDRKPSISYVQRRLKIGYNSAASLIERMEEEGIVSKPNHAGKREVLARSEAEI